MGAVDDHQGGVGTGLLGTTPLGGDVVFDLTSNRRLVQRSRRPLLIEPSQSPRTLGSHLTGSLLRQAGVSGGESAATTCAVIRETISISAQTASGP